MRDPLSNASWWVLSLVTGAIFAGCMVVARLVQHGTGHLTETLFASGIAGVFFGAFMGPVSAHLKKGFKYAMADLPRDKVRATRRAATRGQIPADPQVRRAAARLAGQQLRIFDLLRPVGIGIFGLVTLLDVFLAVTTSAWWWVIAVAFAGACLFYWWWPTHIRRRVQLLTPDDQPGHGSAASRPPTRL